MCYIESQVALTQKMAPYLSQRSKKLWIYFLRKREINGQLYFFFLDNAGVNLFIGVNKDN